MQVDSLPTELSGKSKLKVTQLCLTLCDPLDCTVHGIWNSKQKVTIYSLDILFSQFGTSPLFHVQIYLLLLDLHTDFSEGRYGGLVFPLPSSNNTRYKSIHGHHQLVNTKIRWIIFFVDEDGEALYSEQKQDWELSVAQIMSSLLPKSDLN